MNFLNKFRSQHGQLTEVYGQCSTDAPSIFFENQLMPELAGSFFVEIYAFFFEIVYTSQIDVCPDSK